MSRIARGILCVLLLAACGGAAVTDAGCADVQAAAEPSDLFKFYATNLRASLFSGCMTLGSFLLAVNTFIIVNLKKEVFEHELYKARVRDHRKSRPDYQHYGPLRNLSRVLLTTIIFAFASAVLQLTLGTLWESRASAMVCITTAVLVGLGVFVALFLVGLTMKDWFDFLEKASSSPPAERK